MIWNETLIKLLCLVLSSCDVDDKSYPCLFDVNVFPFMRSYKDIKNGYIYIVRGLTKAIFNYY